MFQGEFEDAMYYFDRAIELRPTLAKAYAHRSLARVNLQDSEGAMRDAQQALRLDDTLVDPYIVFGRVHSENGQPTEALENFNMAVEIAPDEGGPYWWRGRFWREVAQDMELALNDLDMAIELEPAVAAIYLDRAILLIQVRADISRIRADLDEAISLSQDPRLPTIIARAEELHDLLNEIEEQSEAVNAG